MFNIKSKIEFDIPQTIINKSKNYDPDIMGYVCPCCHKKIKSSDFFNKSPEILIKEKLSEKKINSEKLKNLEYCSFIQEYNTCCKICNTPLDAEILIEMQQDEVIDYEIIASDSLEFSLDSFLVMGIDIYSHCKLLFLRWWRANRNIDVIVPFINEDYFQIFFEVMRVAYGFDNSFSDKCVSLNTNPFNKLVFRKNQNTKKTLTEVFNQWASSYMNEKNINYDKMTLYEDIIGDIKDCLYQVENVADDNYKVKRNEENLNLALMYDSYFHAKYFAGRNNDNTELFITSYNFGDIEGLQYETQCINIIDTSEYNNIFDIFQNYFRITFSKV